MQNQKLNINNLPLYMKVTDKKLNGVVYTPEWIVNLILDRVNYKNNIFNKKIVDPSCGEGIFLMFAVNRFLQDCKKNNFRSDKIKRSLEENIYGFDIDKKAVVECKNNLDKIVESHGIKNVNWNILQMDSLDKDTVKKYFNFFDFVVGNPPYIRIQHLGNRRRTKIQKEWNFCKSGSTDTYIGFFELGINLLNNSGQLGYITPNTYFKTQTAESLRLYLSKNEFIKEIIDFKQHQVFDNATTYSAITILKKDWKENNLYYFAGNKNSIKYVDKIKFSNINYKKWVFASNGNLDKIREIRNRGVHLGEIARIHVGITTLADSFYIFENPIFEKNKATFKLKDGRMFTIEKNILKPIIKASILKSAKDEQNRYIIYPYKKINGRSEIIQKDELKKKYPLTYEYFSAIKERLLLRDKGKNRVSPWYAFGRSQGLSTSWGKKILLAPLKIKPNFIVWEKEDYTFYAGYCIKFDGDLRWLAKQLNSDDMEFYIKHTSRDYQSGYKSYAKSFIANFGIKGYKTAQAQLAF